MARARNVPHQPLGQLLRELRQRRRWSMRQLAQASGVSAGYIQQLEAGLDRRSGRPIRPSPEVLRRLAGPLGGAYYEVLMAAAGYLPSTGALARQDGYRTTLPPEVIREIQDIVAETTLEVLRRRGLL